jgi:DNA invertase Pin-like site-specific DNA recombinase
MADAARRRFDVVLVYKLDRFGHSVLNLSQVLAALDSYGVRFIAVSQGLDTDRSNPTSRLLLNVLSAVAEFERELIVERTVSGIRAARENGVTSGDRKECSAGMRSCGSGIRRGCPGAGSRRSSACR